MNFSFLISIQLGLFLLIFGLPLLAQEDDRICYLSIHLDSQEEELRQARFYQETRSGIEIELISFTFARGEKQLGRKIIVPYNPEEDAWTVKLDKGYYLLRTKHIGFSTIRETLILTNYEHKYNYELQTDWKSYSYHNGKKFSYIRGGLNFSETIVVHFQAGTAEENMAFLKDNFPIEKVQKIKYSNSFLLTVVIPLQETLAEVLLRDAQGDSQWQEGYYMGDIITKFIETIQENPNVKYANPSFIEPKDKVETLSLKNYANGKELLEALRFRNQGDVLRLNAQEFEKSDALKQKLLQKLEE